MNLQERAKEVVVDNNGIAKSADFVAAGIRAVDVVNLCNAGFLNPCTTRILSACRTKCFFRRTIACNTHPKRNSLC